MIKEPFTLFHPYRDRVSIGWWIKKDDVTIEETGIEMNTDACAHTKQMHGGTVLYVDAATSDPLPQADAVITDTKKLLLLTKSADCQSIVFYDPEKSAAAAVHAGWKGLLANIIPNTIREMTSRFGSKPENILTGIAPSLGLCCAEFSDPTSELSGIDPKFFHGRNADLQSIADQQLKDAGVDPHNIERMTLCTKSNPDILWSYRHKQDDVKNGHVNILGIILK